MTDIIQLEKGNWKIRYTIIDGEPHFVAADVAAALGYTWQPNVVAHVPDKFKGINPINTPGGTQKMLTLTEAGMNFFVIRSDKAAAVPFQEWLSADVLPSIRKHGMYATKPMTALEALAQTVAVLQEQDRRVSALESTVRTIQDTILDRPEDWRTEVHDMITRAARRAGGKYQEFWQQAYDRLEERTGCRLNIRLDNLKARMAGKIPVKAYDKLSRLDVIKEDRALRELFWEIAKQFVIATVGEAV